MENFLLGDENKPDQRFDNNGNNNSNRALLCTTRSSLVLASFAFCTVQFLTIALCVISWLHKKEAIKFRVKHPSEERFY